VKSRSMKFEVLATDFDGTLAFDGHVDGPTLRGLERARAGGMKLVMVTGRELADLFNTFPETHVFDRIVAENGAVLYDPADGSITTLAPAPPPALVEQLSVTNVPLSVGHVIVATVAPYERQVLDAIRDLGLDWHVIFNKGSVMALPSDVTKATGLMPTLATLGVPLSATVGVGDAENDDAFLRLCGLSAAVSNALPAVREAANVVTRGARGAGVTELIDRVLAGEFD
jgi:hydroxymethylpyrimidine pyrophosphatase-like HAD family hydrolase